VAWQVSLVTTAMRLQVLSPYVDAASLSSDNPENQCTQLNRPPDSKRMFKCDDRDCEKLERRSRKLSACFSLKALDCGETYSNTRLGQLAQPRAITAHHQTRAILLEQKTEQLHALRLSTTTLWRQRRRTVLALLLSHRLARGNVSIHFRGSRGLRARVSSKEDAMWKEVQQWSTQHAPQAADAGGGQM